MASRRLEQPWECQICKKVIQFRGKTRHMKQHETGYAEWKESRRLAAMETRGANPKYRAYLSARMTAKNPMKDAESKEKMRASIIGLQKDGKIKPYGGRKYGNGKGMTPAELAFHNLFPTAIYNYAIRTYMPETSGYPGVYKTDFAWPEKKISVEIDGTSHTPLSRKQTDAKKEEFITKIGWTCFRLTNDQILLNQIPLSTLKSLQTILA